MLCVIANALPGLQRVAYRADTKTILPRPSDQRKRGQPEVGVGNRIKYGFGEKLRAFFHGFFTQAADFECDTRKTAKTTLVALPLLICHTIILSIMGAF